MVCHTFPTKEVKIRRDRSCYGCCDKYKQGDPMYHHTGVSEDGFWHAYYCEICNTFLEDEIKWCDYEDGIGDGDLREDNRYLPFRQKFINGLLP